PPALYAQGSGYHSYRDSFNTSEFIFNMEYLFHRGLKKPEIPGRCAARLTLLHHTQEHSASLHRQLHVRVIIS
ncbi:hypothetical protein, partial [Klebsiella pneumoniae]|uniref:hypothetical protein n=1 Tax=Klebsiella pneumoniae TaxID=573 RepID=UPI001C6F7585